MSTQRIRRGQSTVKVVKKREVKGYWNCKYCGTTHIDGLVDNCPNCGVHKPSDTKNNVDKNNLVEVSKEELAKAGIVHSETGEKRPEWKCPYCESFNNWLDTNCTSCGASKNDSKEDYFGKINQEDEESNMVVKDVYEPEEDEYTITEDEHEPEENVYNTTYNSDIALRSYKKQNSYKGKSYKDSFNYKNTVSTKSYNGIVPKLGIVAFIIAFIALMLYGLMPFEESTTVSSIYWERSISIEEKQTLRDSNWSVPAGARVYDEKEEFYGFKDVIDYYEEVEVEKEREVFSHNEKTTETELVDNGDGTYTEVTYEIETPIYVMEKYTETEEVPVYKKVEEYKTKYYYEYDVWKEIYTSDSNGTDKNVYWNTNYTLSNNQRDTDKKQSYYVNYSNGDKKVCSYDEWCKVNIGDSVTITKCRIGIIYSQSVNYINENTTTH